MTVHELPHHRSLPQLFTDVVNLFSTLVTNEVRLARAEVSDNLSRAGIGLALIIGGAVLLIPAFVILLSAAVQAIVAAGYAEHWAALIVGGSALLIGLIVVMVGVNRIKPQALVPNRTIEQVRRDAALATQQGRPTYDSPNHAA